MINVPVQIKNSGMTSDAFERTSNFRTLVHFDPISFPDQLVPHRSTENGDASTSTDQIGVFEYANSKFYGLSLAGSGNAQRLYSRENADVGDATWDAPTTTSATQVPDGIAFIDYKRAGKLFWSLTAGNLASYTYASSSYNANGTGGALSSINATGQGLVHSDDNIFYVPVVTPATGIANIATYDATSWNPGFFSNGLPSNLIIVSICEYGKFLAIGCAPANGYGKSCIFLWDKTSPSWTEVIDLGYRNLQIIEQIEGEIIAISFSTSNTFAARITFQSYAGGQPEIFRELISTATYTIGNLSQIKQKYGSRLYFMLTVTLNGNLLQGIWRVSRAAPGQSFTVSFDYLPNGDTGLTGGLLNGFYLWGDYMFISYVSSSVYGMSKTDDQANYTSTAYAESIFNPGLNDADYLVKKSLLKIGANFSPLSAGQQVVLKYRVDGRDINGTVGAWNTVFTKTATTPTTDPSTYTSNKDAAGKNFDQGTYYEFRLESTGGAVITDYSWQYDVVAQQQ